MKVTFCAPSSRRPIGGVISLYEFANGLSRRGHDVQIVHLPGVPDPIERVEDVDFFDFAPAIEHVVSATLDEAVVRDADFVEITAPAFFGGPAFLGALAAQERPRIGLPFVFVQGLDYLPKASEQRGFSTPYPKVCVARWLRTALAERGVAPQLLEFVPYGLDHEVFRLVRPIERRPRKVAMLCHPHPVKGTRLGITSLLEVQRRDPTVEVVLFGTTEPRLEIPESMTYVRSPPRDMLVDDIYNGSRVFVCPSLREGFGFCGIEAMAGGSVLVTTSNGGSDDYAIDGENALLVEPHDATVMADRIEQVLDDDELRVRLASRGVEFVKRFDWDESARLLEAVLVAYGAGR